jgi:hypothetical protein
MTYGAPFCSSTSIWGPRIQVVEDRSTTGTPGPVKVFPNVTVCGMITVCGDIVAPRIHPTSAGGAKVNIRRVFAAGAAFLLVAAASFMGSASAHADGLQQTCKGGVSAYTHQAFRFCAGVDSYQGAVHGWSSTANATMTDAGPLGTITIYVEQCDAYGHNCRTYVANRGIAVNALNTSDKPTSFGHVYRGCGSFVGSGVTVGPFCSATALY